MIKKRCSLVFSIIVMSLFLCHGSFAQNITLPPARGGWVLEHQSQLSSWALSQIENRFNEVIGYLEGIANDPSTQEEHKAWINNTFIPFLESKRAKIDSIDVYLVQTESSPGDAFNDVYYYFEDEGYSPQKEDLDAKKGRAEQKVQEIKSQDLEEAVNELVTVGKISKDTKDALIALINGGNVEAARGSKTLPSGETKRISILTVYAIPLDFNDPAEKDFDIIEKTTVVIATDLP